MRNKTLDIQRMIEIETRIDDIQSILIGDAISNETLLEKLNLKDEQEINYATAATILKYKEMKEFILKYDNSKPKMDELKFVQDICRIYGQEATTVIRRIKEVRMLMKKRMTA